MELEGEIMAFFRSLLSFFDFFPGVGGGGMGSFGKGVLPRQLPRYPTKLTYIPQLMILIHFVLHSEF